MLPSEYLPHYSPDEFYRPGLHVTLRASESLDSEGRSITAWESGPRRWFAVRLVGRSFMLAAHVVSGLRNLLS